jgi:hypothetical protein
VPKDDEIVVDRPHELSNSKKDIVFYENELTKAFSEGRRVLHKNGIGTVVFASKTTASWEAVLRSVIDSGLVVTGSWPIDTEREARIAAHGQARLGSSVHIVCRPRPQGLTGENLVGDWRKVLAELPRRIHEWMPRLAAEGVVGADAIFACLGPALEVFSRYARVERANGEIVPLREFLEQVWAAVSREALSMIFADPDTAGLDEDARLTAIWLWTIAAPKTVGVSEESDEVDGDEVAKDDEKSSSSAMNGFILEFDAARKIAQGLGARLEALEHVIEVKGDTARLVSVAERTNYLFGRTDGVTPARNSRKKPQRALFEELEEAAEQQGWGEIGTPKVGNTTLDRVHQAMLLFGSGRAEALRRFLIEEGVGKQPHFWKLAQSLSALYPIGSEEKRWVDGVLARKKALGFG